MKLHRQETISAIESGLKKHFGKDNLMEIPSAKDSDENELKCLVSENEKSSSQQKASPFPRGSDI